MQNAGLNKTDIEQFWGSMEAYNEEQRRLGLYQLEAAQESAAFRPSLFGNAPRTANTEQTEASHRASFHFFGHRA